MNRVFVLDKNGEALMPCHPARARKLLKKGRAKVVKAVPFTIQIDRSGNVQPVEVKIDQGSKTTGLALVASGKKGLRVIFAMNLEHRGEQIKSNLITRSQLRRSRRSRNTRYRQARFLNRTKPKGWLAPSVQSRMDNTLEWLKRFIKWSPLTSIAYEKVKFDTQKIMNPDIQGIEYQQGEMFGKGELFAYLLEKFKRTCVYCGKSDFQKGVYKPLRFEIDHIVPRSQGGTNRVSNFALSCHKCNQKKGNKSINEFLKNKPDILRKVKSQCKRPLAHTSAVNQIRNALELKLQEFDLPVNSSTGYITSQNRKNQGYEKDHWIDATCVGDSGKKVFIPKGFKAIKLKKEQRNFRQRVQNDKYGFPRKNKIGNLSVKTKEAFGFKTGYLVSAINNRGYYFGRVAIRKTGSFDIKTKKGMVTVNHKFCRIVQKTDGYSYL